MPKRIAIPAAAAAVTLAWSLCAAGGMTAWEEYLRKPAPDRASRVQAISYAAPATDPG